MTTVNRDVMLTMRTDAPIVEVRDNLKQVSP
jgi:hypothetical protein